MMWSSSNFRMGQSLSRLKNFTSKYMEIIPSVRYKRMLMEEQRRNSELETIIKNFSDNNIVNEQIVEIRNSISRVHDEVQGMRSSLSAPANNKVATVKGSEGEDFVLTCLREAFPNNTGIVKSGEHRSGDIQFRLEQSDKIIMFEVKNLNKGYVSSINHGKDIDKFFHDLHNSSINYSGGVLVSLNGPVDINTPSRVPHISRGKPYLFLDSLKQFPDPVCLLHVVVTMMEFMMKFSENLQDTSTRMKLESYVKQTEKLMKIYKDLLRDHTKQRKNIDCLKTEIEEMKHLLLVSGKILILT